MASKIRVLVGDSYPVVRRGLKTFLESASDMEVIAESGGGLEFLAAFREQRPDVGVIDFCEVRQHTVALIAELLADFPDARVLIFTSFDGEDDLLMALRAGVRGYVLKTASANELAEAIRAVAGGKKYVPPHLVPQLAQTNFVAPLSEREREVLASIASGKSNREIGSALFISEGTVKFHINNILVKLNAADRTEAVVIGFQRGLLRLSES